MKPRHEIVIAIKHRRQKAGQKQPVGEVEMPHDAEIDRHQGAVGRDEDIAGVHVGMEKAVPEHLVEETARRRFGDFLDVMPGRLEPGDVVDPHPIDPFDDEHRRGGVFEIDPGNMDAGVFGHVVGKLAGGGGLQSQVELDVRNAGELVDRGDELQPPQVRRQPFEDARQRIEKGGVGLHAPADPGAKKFHRHLSPVGQFAVMHLGDGGRGDRHLVKPAEGLFDRRAGFPDYLAPCNSRPESRKPVLKKAQRKRHVRADQIGPCRQRLTEFDETRPEADQGFGKRASGVAPRAV